ncbi:MAG: MFS transporter [Candidatus Bathyarchaeia archaeon]
MLGTMGLTLLSSTYPSMTQELGVPISLVGLALGASSFVRLFASLISGVWGNKFGRVHWLRVSNILLIITLVLVSRIWNVVSFILLVVLVGFTYQSVISLTLILVAEHSPAKHRGWLTGITNAFAFGATLGPLLGLWALSSGLGWRFPWIVLVIPAAINLVQSFFIKEPERYLEMRNVIRALKRGEKPPQNLKYPLEIEKAQQSSFRQLFGKDIRRTSILFAVWLGFATVIWYNGSTYWALLFSAEKGMSYMESVAMFGYLWILSEPGFLGGAFLGQVVGRNQIMCIGCVIAAVGNFVLAQFAYGFTQVVLMAAVMMIGQGIIWGAFPSYSSEIAPTRIRTMFAAFSSVISSIVSAVTLPLMVFSSQIVGWGMTYQLFVTSSAVLCAVLLLFLPKPRPRAGLEEIAK